MKIGGGKVVSRHHGLLSKDGRTATFTVTATDEQGRPLQNVYVYEKQ
jgi:protocatechuate 3,4-dioxygenase beta subunit